MRINRFSIKNEIPDDGIFILENERIVHQLSRVLKIKKGEKIIFFNGSGFDFLMRVDKLAGRFVSGKIVEKIKNEKDPQIEVHLYQSLIKKNKFELVLEKGTELGVKFFHPIISERSIKMGLNIERARRIVQEATEQSGQDKIPQIFEAVKFEEALTEVENNGFNIIFDMEGKQKPVLKANFERVNLFIGPEGGFLEREIEAAKNADFIIISLGLRILRSETSSIVAGSFFLTQNFS